jgi:hypothetical protein
MKSNLFLCAGIIAALALGRSAVTAASADTVVVSADRMIDVLTYKDPHCRPERAAWIFRE